MEARYFRYLFENVPDGIIQCGYLEDTTKKDKMFYVYFAENNERRVSTDTYCSVFDALDSLPQEKIDLLVLSNFKLFYIVSILELVKTHKIHTVVLPYVAPMERMMTEQYMPLGEDVIRFMADPYTTLLEMGVENVYYLYGNGENITANPDTFAEGEYFESVEEDILELAQLMEGKAIPVVKAGYMVKCGWLFYFGNYGMNLSAIMQRMVAENRSRIGTENHSTVTMYAGPLDAAPQQTDSLFTVKTYTREMKCKPSILSDGMFCDLKCIRYQDHDTIKHHTGKNETTSSFGVLLMGNLNLKLHMYELAKRYNSVAKQIRVTNIPDDGELDKWNSQILEMFGGTDYHYWVAAINRQTSGEVLKEILTTNPYYRIVNVNADYGSCFSGYLVKKEK